MGPEPERDNESFGLSENVDPELARQWFHWSLVPCLFGRTTAGQLPPNRHFQHVKKDRFDPDSTVSIGTEMVKPNELRET